MRKRLRNTLREWFHADYDAAELKTLLKKIKHTTGTANIERRVDDAIHYVEQVGAKRQANFDNPLYANPLLITKALLKQPSVNEDTVVAAIIYGVFVNRLNTKAAPLDLKEFEKTYLPEIAQKFGGGVAGRVLNALQIEELEVLDRKSNVYTTATMRPKPPQTAEQQRLGIVAMVQQRIEYTDSALMRLAQRSVRIDLIPPGILSAENRRTLQTTREVYLPIAFANGLRDIGRHIKDQLIPHEDPSGYAKIRELKRQAREAVAVAAGKGDVADPAMRVELTLREIERQVKTALVIKGYQEGVHYEMQRREKSDSSIYEKTRGENKNGRKRYLSDIMAFRIVVNSADEAAAARAIEQTLKQIFVQVRGKDYITTPKANGYQALNGAYEVRSRRNAGFDSLPKDAKAQYSEREDDRNARGRFEIIVVGAEMHRFNEEGTASHIAYKGYGSAASEVGRSKKMVSVYLPNNEVRHMPRGATVADLAASIGADFAFSVKEARIQRGHFTPPVQGRNILAERLESGDRVEFVPESNLAKSRRRREYVINAARTDWALVRLKAKHEFLSRPPEDIRAAYQPVIVKGEQIGWVRKTKLRNKNALREALKEVNGEVTALPPRRQSSAERRNEMMLRRQSRLVLEKA